MIKAKLFVLKQEIELLWVNMYYHRDLRKSGRPASEVMGGLIKACYATDANTDRMLRWMTKESEDVATNKEIDKMENGKVCFYDNGFDYPPTKTYAFNDAHLIYFKEVLNVNGSDAMQTIITISPAVQDYGAEFLKYWCINRISPSEVMPYQPSVSENPITQIINLKWVNSNTQENDITEIGYKENASLIANIENAKGSTATITIKKEDGSEFENGQTQLTFTEAIKDGMVELTPMEIKEQWEAFKTSDIDKLIAKVEHGGATKASKPLQIKPSPQVIVNFRPHNNWKGEFGFDWIRIGDTKLFGDNKYENIVSKQYTDAAFTKLELDENKSKGYFKKDPNLLKALKTTYDKFTLPWSKKDSNGKQTPEDYSVPWLSLLKDKESKLELVLDIKQAADYIEFEDNDYFSFTPCKLDIKGKTGQVTTDKSGNALEVTISCHTDFKTDQEILINAFQEKQNTDPLKLEAGKIKAWANDATKQKEKKVVFVQMITKLSKTSKSKKANVNSEKNRINNYLNQAFIQLHKDSKIIDLDLTADKNFLKFVKKGNIDYNNSKDKELLHNFIKKKLKTDFKGVYDHHFKAFYFAEPGGSTGGLSGYSVPNADFVVVFKSANDQTASHEFLHALNLAHSFSNKEADSNATYTYEYKKTDNLLDYSHHVKGHKNSRCSLWYWQWKKANQSIK